MRAPKKTGGIGVVPELDDKEEWGNMFEAMKFHGLQADAARFLHDRVPVWNMSVFLSDIDSFFGRESAEEA